MKKANLPNYESADFVDGNFEDKYRSKNPISKLLVGRFVRNFTDLSNVLDRMNPSRIVEIGAGEGELTSIVAGKYSKAQVIACDISDRVNALAAKKLSRFPNASVQKENAEEVTFESNSVDMVVCCEVLEHVLKPRIALSELYRILKPGGYAIISVPNEPIWRILNLCRLQYIKHLGNTPGHVNHWSNGAFKKFVKSAGFIVIKDKSPFPWTMLLVQK